MKIYFLGQVLKSIKGKIMERLGRSSDGGKVSQGSGALTVNSSQIKKNIYFRDGIQLVGWGQGLQLRDKDWNYE